MSPFRSSPPHAARHDQQTSGFALVVVILVLLMVTVLAAELSFAVRVGTLEGFNIRKRLVGRALAHGGVNQALFSLLDRPLDFDNDQLSYLGMPHDSPLETGHLRYVVINESGKIDLNGASRYLITSLAAYLGLDEEEQEIVADSLEDWRDADNLHRLQGAEDDYYQDLDEPYRARNGRFIEISELALVRGTEKITAHGNLADLFTIHNPGGKINFNSLSPAMLAFLTEDDPDRISSYHELRSNQGDLSAVEAQLILGNERYQECAEFLAYNDNKVRFYTVSAVGYAGMDQQEIEETEPPGTRVRVLFEKNGATIRYYGWQEEWS